MGTQNQSSDTVIISGGLGDIGRATTKAFLATGARVAIGDRLPPAEAAPLLKEFGASDDRLRYTSVDVADAAAVDNWWDGVTAAWGLPNVVIPNAAIVAVKGYRELTAADWHHELSINLSGAFHLAHRAALRLSDGKTPGHIILVGSWVAARPQTHIPTYCVAKAGVRMLCQTLAREFAADGIQVNEVAPGIVDAGLSGKLFSESPGRRENALAQIPINRLITADEVAHQILTLCHPANRHMTGSTVTFDGGLSLG